MTSAGVVLAETVCVKNSHLSPLGHTRHTRHAGHISTNPQVNALPIDLSGALGEDLIGQVNDIADQLKSDTLPLDPLVMHEYDESIQDVYRDRPFVRQLLWIALDNVRLWKAIRDYHRSYTLRSFWLRHQLVAESELDRFAFRLHDEWEQIFDTKIAAMIRRGERTPRMWAKRCLKRSRRHRAHGFGNASTSRGSTVGCSTHLRTESWVSGSAGTPTSRRSWRNCSPMSEGSRGPLPLSLIHI